jgi:hypothetical protein
VKHRIGPAKSELAEPPALRSTGRPINPADFYRGSKSMLDIGLAADCVKPDLRALADRAGRSIFEESRCRKQKRKQK